MHITYIISYHTTTIPWYAKYHNGISKKSWYVVCTKVSTPKKPWYVVCTMVSTPKKPWYVVLCTMVSTPKKPSTLEKSWYVVWYVVCTMVCIFAYRYDFSFLILKRPSAHETAIQISCCRFYQYLVQ